MALIPIASPQTFSRGKDDLSIKREGIHCCSSFRAAEIPAGPAPTIHMSLLKVISMIKVGNLVIKYKGKKNEVVLKGLILIPGKLRSCEKMG